MGANFDPVLIGLCLMVLAIGGIGVFLRPRLWPAWMSIPAIYLAANGFSVSILSVWQAFILVSMVTMRSVKSQRNTRPTIKTTQVDNLTAFLFLMCGVTLFWGVLKGNEITAIVEGVYVIFLPVLVFFLVRTFPVTPRDLRTILGMFAIFSVPLSVYGFFILPERFTVNSAAISGSLSHIGILWTVMPGKRSSRPLRLLIFILCLADIYFSATRRFILPAVGALAVAGLTSKMRSYFLLFGTPFLAGLLVFGNLAQVEEEGLLERGIGYRSAEYPIVLAYALEKNVALGAGLGGQTDQLLLGTKGLTQAGPRFHNFYLTLLFNGGFALASIYVLWLMAIVWISFRGFQREFYAAKPEFFIWAFFAIWVAVAAFDSPRDGLWLIGLLPAYFISRPRHTPLIGLEHETTPLDPRPQH